MRRHRATYGPAPEFILRRERDRLIILAIGVLALLVGVLLIIGVAVAS